MPPRPRPRDKKDGKEESARLLSEPGALRCREKRARIVIAARGEQVPLPLCPCRPRRRSSPAPRVAAPQRAAEHSGLAPFAPAAAAVRHPAAPPRARNDTKE